MHILATKILNSWMSEMVEGEIKYVDVNFSDCSTKEWSL